MSVLMGRSAAASGSDVWSSLKTVRRLDGDHKEGACMKSKLKTLRATLLSCKPDRLLLAHGGIS